MLFINLKTYQRGTGKLALEFVKHAEELYREIPVPITILAQAADVRLLAENTSMPIWSQHMDNIEYGKNTGWILPSALIEAGAKGTMINHAEHKMPLADVSSMIEKYMSSNFGILVSTTSPEETMLMDQLHPNFVTYEPQEYIGTKTSVVDAAPDVIKSLAAKLNSSLVIGAGIHAPKHITDGIMLGAKGFLISSGILLDNDPKARLKEYMIAYNDAYNTLNQR